MIPFNSLNTSVIEIFGVALKSLPDKLTIWTVFWLSFFPLYMCYIFLFFAYFIIFIVVGDWIFEVMWQRWKLILPLS